MKVTKQNGFGEYPNPEQFLLYDEDCCQYSDSVMVYDFLVNNLAYPEEIKVLPVEIEFKRNNIFVSSDNFGDLEDVVAYVFWVAMDIANNKVYTFVPAFSFDDFEKFSKEYSFTDIKLIEHDRYFVWNNTFGAVIITDNGNAVIRKVNGVWSEYDVRSMMNVKEPELVFPEIYPVNLFSLSEHKFLCSAWSIVDTEKERILWYLVHWDDNNVLSNYALSDITELPLDVGDVTLASNVKLEVAYSKEYGLYLRKTNRPLPEHIEASKHLGKTSLKEKTLGKSMVIELKPEFNEQVKLVEGAKLIPLYPQQKK